MTFKVDTLPGNAGSVEKMGSDQRSEANACLEPIFPLPASFPNASRQVVVIDTNIILDIFVFADAAAKLLKKALEAGELDWIATLPMRGELARVLDYPQIVPRLAFYQLSADDVLASFDRNARLVEVAAKARLSCRDPDDQKFIDLAVAAQSLLLSKDQHVLSMSKRLLAHGVRAQAAI